MRGYSLTDFRKLSLLRAHLEGLASHHAAAQAADLPDYVTELKGTLPDLIEAIRERDYSTFLREDRHLHETIVRMADVPFLHDSWLLVWNGLEPLHQSSVGSWPDLTVLSRDHEYLVETICLGYPAAAEEAARSHIEMFWYRYDKGQRETDPSDPIQRAIAYLTFHMSGPVRLEDVARVAFTSPGNLSRLFRRRIGMNFQAYLQKLRLEKGAELLADTRLPVSRIAHRVGYRDVSRFGQHFKRFQGLTPTQWRKQRRQ
jgi:AraC-like DNA-binding protein